MEQSAHTATATLDPQAQEPQLDPGRVAALQARLEREQNLPLGVTAGAIAALLGAAAWAAITVATEYQIGWMAIGIGFLVGFAVRMFGNGVSQPFGYFGAGLALVGCLLGNLLSACGFIAQQEPSAALLDVTLGVLSQPVIAAEIMRLTFTPIDLLFYGLAVYEGYRLSFRELTEADVFELVDAGDATPR